MEDNRRDEPADDAFGNVVSIDGYREARPDAEEDPLRHSAYQPSRATRARKAVSRQGQRARQVAYDKTPERFKNATGLQVRFRTGFVYVAVSVVAVLVNDVTTMAYLALVSAICAHEFYYMMREDDKLPNDVIGVVAAAAYPVAMWYGGSVGMLALTVLLMMALFIWYVYWMHARVADVAVSMFGAVYTGLLLSPLVPLRAALPAPWGGVFLLLLFASVWFNDAGAYLVGSKFGKHKLAPRVSPKKTWEGLIAGLVVSALFWCGMSFVPGVTMPLWQAAVFGVVCGASGVLGDLTESRIKRNVGVKDSGTIMPGHGGLLDRCDSLFFCSVTAVILLYFGGCVPFAW